jgi:hypothetical protein
VFDDLCVPVRDQGVERVGGLRVDVIEPRREVRADAREALRRSASESWLA